MEGAEKDEKSQEHVFNKQEEQRVYESLIIEEEPPEAEEHIDLLSDEVEEDASLL